MQAIAKGARCAVSYGLRAAHSLCAREFVCIPELRRKTETKIKTTSHSNCIDSHWPWSEWCQRELNRLLTNRQRSSFSLQWTLCSSVRPEVKIVGFPLLSVKQLTVTIVRWFLLWLHPFLIVVHFMQKRRKCPNTRMRAIHLCVIHVWITHVQIWGFSTI